MINRKIAGLGHAIAKNYVTNDDLSKIVETSDEWIVQRTGIKSRYISTEENTSDLGYRAALMAIKDANIDKESIDLIIVATITPDCVTPSCACLIQEKLGLNGKEVMAFDLNAACSGFIYAMQVAANLLNDYKVALIIGSETLSKIIDWEDRNTCVLFGDGAGAMILTSEDNPKQMHFYAQSIGDVSKKLACENKPLSSKAMVNLDSENYYLKMDGPEVFRFAIKAIEEGVRKVLAKAQLDLTAIDLVIPHQANIRIIQHAMKKLKLDQSKFFVNLDQYGNTSAASIVLALSEAKHQGKLKENTKIVLIGFGAGFTYASALIEI